MFLSLAFCTNAQTKTRIAIVDFKPGVGVDESMVNSLSDMLINSMFTTKHYTIVERTQIDKVIREQGFQKKDITESQVVKAGQILGVKAIVLGTVNKISDEYNIDVRIVDTENGELIATAGVTKRKEDTYRDLMQNLSVQLDELIYGKKPEETNSAIERIGNLYIFPVVLNTTGYDQALKQCNYYNERNKEGISNWRVPTETELCEILENRWKLKNRDFIVRRKWYFATLDFGIKGMYKIVKIKKNGLIKRATKTNPQSNALLILVSDVE